VSINQVNLAGGVGYIAEQKIEDLYTFSLMCKAPSQVLLNYSWQDSMGFRIECWGDDAKRLSSLLYVGRQMSLAGSLRYNTWTAQDGSPRSTYQVRVRSSQYSLFGKNQNQNQNVSNDTDKSVDRVPANVVSSVTAGTIDPPF
jgi:single-stranded DNA-binding protein